METPEIYDAATFGDFDSVRELLADDPACVNAVDEYGFTPLHGVAGEDQLEMAQLLIKSGADVNARNDEGITPLHSVAYPEMVELLVRHGANVNARSADGSTPLHVQASEPDTEDVIEALLNAGADPSLKDQRGKTARDYAVSRDEPEKAALLAGDESRDTDS